MCYIIIKLKIFKAKKEQYQFLSVDVMKDRK